jgi:hypothetical protein
MELAYVARRKRTAERYRSEARISARLHVPPPHRKGFGLAVWSVLGKPCIAKGEWGYIHTGRDVRVKEPRQGQFTVHRMGRPGSAQLGRPGTGMTTARLSFLARSRNKPSAARAHLVTVFLVADSTQQHLATVFVF